MGERLPVFILIIFFLTACGRSKTPLPAKPSANYSYPFKIDLVQGLENPAQIKLSDIADSIRYVVLSNKNGLYLRYINDLDVSNNNIFIQGLCDNPVFLRYNMSGEFLNRIGNYGRGPGEYLSGSEFSVDEEDSNVIVYRNFIHDFARYRFTGEYLGRLPVESQSDPVRPVCLPGGKILVIPFYSALPDHVALPEKPFFCRLYDFNNRLVMSVPHPIRNNSGVKIDRSILAVTFSTFFQNEAVISQYNCDTVYKASGDTIYPAFIFNSGKYAPGYMQRFSWTRPAESFGFLKGTGKTFETKSNVYKSFSMGDKGYLFAYDKSGNRSKSMSFGSAIIENGIYEFPNLGFINDIDGGANFNPWWSNREGNIWIAAEEAIDFKKRHNADLLSTPTAKDKAAGERLRKLVRELNDSDNPVLILVYLKK